MRYFVEPNVAEPKMLVRIDWAMGIAQVIGPNQTKWTQRDSLYDMLHDSDGAEITEELASKIASKWGGAL